jgi:hypothetical protein
MWCCGSSVPIGWPSSGAPTASSSTASGCRPSTSMTGRRSRSVIRGEVLGWFFKSAHPPVRHDNRSVHLNARPTRRHRSPRHPRSLPAAGRCPRSGTPSECHYPRRNPPRLSDQSSLRRHPRSDRSRHQCHPSDRPRRRPHHHPRRPPHHRPQRRPHHRRPSRPRNRRPSRSRRQRRRRRHLLPRMSNHRVGA